MAIDYSYPSWLVPKHDPWQALVAGVQAGSQIAATRQRGRQLSMQAQQQAFQDSVLQAKTDADTADMTALREWWPAVSSATGDELLAAQPPVLRNSEMMGRLSLMLEKRKRDYGSAELAGTASRVKLATPEGQAEFWRTYQKVRGAGVPIEDASQMIERAERTERLKLEAEERAGYREDLLSFRREHQNFLEQQAAEKARAEGFDPQVMVVKGERVIKLGPNRWQYLGAEVPIEKLPAGIRASIYNHQIEEADKELYDLPTEGAGIAERRQAIEAKKQTAIEARDAMLKTPTGKTAAPAGPETLPTATNPTTGKRVIFKDGRWQPLK